MKFVWFFWSVRENDNMQNVTNETITGTSLSWDLLIWIFLSMKNKVSQTWVLILTISLNSWNTFQMKHIQVCPFYEILLITSFIWKHFLNLMFFMNTLQVRQVSYEIIIVCNEICLVFVIWQSKMISLSKCCKRNKYRYVIILRFIYFYCIFPWKKFERNFVFDVN